MTREAKSNFSAPIGRFFSLLSKSDNFPLSSVTQNPLAFPASGVKEEFFFQGCRNLCSLNYNSETLNKRPFLFLVSPAFLSGLCHVCAVHTRWQTGPSRPGRLRHGPKRLQSLLDGANPPPESHSDPAAANWQVSPRLVLLPPLVPGISQTRAPR